MTSLNLDVIGKETEERTVKYTWKDVILYNLGIGAQPDELKFVYERYPGGVQVFPSYACILAGIGFPRFSDKPVDGARFIHGEQMIKLLKPFPSEGEHIFDAKYVHFYIGEGGWGGDRGPKAEPLDPPEGKEPDFSVSYKTNINQAAIYRLSGDYNPLHLDPEFAKRSGRFDRPILHGLCTYGYATRSIVYGLCDGDVSRFKEFKARFTSEVYPGETLTTEGWKDNGRYIVQVRTDRGPVLGNAYAIVE